jgi:hypothetical protein
MGTLGVEVKGIGISPSTIMCFFFSFLLDYLKIHESFKKKMKAIIYSTSPIIIKFKCTFNEKKIKLNLPFLAHLKQVLFY